ncbi:hypothetical protein HMPREF1869_01361 [Bacteroidales bacterium KA00251]|nr:hypothetical protein HMPREF1869_01361 [Bacteroidales bacterium KA00251]
MRRVPIVVRENKRIDNPEDRRMSSSVANGKKQSWWSLVVWLVFPLVCLTSCSMEDVRDACCESVVLQYRYISKGKDMYAQFVHTERRFLFDSNGKFMYEVPVDSTHRPIVRLRRLPKGTYSMLTIGNRTEKGSYLDAMKPGITSLQEITLALGRRTADQQAFANAEELFWNLRTFDARCKQTCTYLCDMANLHCYLHVKIGWEGDLPLGSDRYTLELSKLLPRYRMEINPKYTLEVKGKAPNGADRNEPTPNYSVHHYPYAPAPHDAVVRTVNSLRGRELFYEVRTLRYLNEAIPTLQVWHDGVQLFKRPIDLTPIFKDWGWYPNLNPEQVYRIELRILKSGQVEVKPWVSGSVLDWEDGGNFGG